MSNYRRNYTGGGIYFFTVVLANRHSELLLRHIEDFRAAYAEAQRHHPFETVAICVLPDHFHLLMGLPEGDSDYSLRLSAIKHNFSRRLPAAVKKPNVSQSGKREAGVWQRRFWEHLIRDEDDLQRHMDYISQPGQARLCIGGQRLAAVIIPARCRQGAVCVGLGCGCTATESHEL